MDVACLLIEHFPVKVERQRHAALRNRAFITARTQGSKQTLMDFSPELEGLALGMPLQEALSRCKGAEVIEPDLPYYQETFHRILSALEQRSPIVEDKELGLAYVDIRGLEGLYGGRAGLAKALLDAVPHIFEAKLGIAKAKFPAYVAATTSSPGRASTVPENVKGFLASFPVDILPVSWRTRAALRGFGLHTLGQLATLPIGPLQAQFGREGESIWKLARGIDNSPVLPRTAEETITEQLSFPEPTIHLEALTLGIEALLSRAFSHLQLRNRHARGATLQAEIARGAPWMKRISFRQAAGDVRTALYAIRPSLESLTLPGPVEDVSLTLWGLTGEAGLQSSLLMDVRRTHNLKDSLQQLEARLGSRPPIYQVREVEPWSRIPERRRALVPLSL